MNTKKKPFDEGGVAVMSSRVRPKRSRGRLAVVGLALALVIGAGYAVWHHVRAHVLSSSAYQVHAEHISITPPPPAWIRGEIKADVLRDLNRKGPLSLLDDDLTVRVAGAFAAHPWVTRVDRVSKRYPSGVDVVLAYRVPVAMVEVQKGKGVLPVDEHGVVLPTRDAAGKLCFTSEEAEQYPRIGEIYTMPAGPAGTRWGDAGVLGGAQIAAALGPDWKTLDLARITPVERKPARTGVEYTFALVTHSGTMVFWGRAPGTDTAGEVPAAEKIAQLKRYAAANGGTLDGPNGPQEIEIDGRGALLRKVRPVVTPLPKRPEAPRKLEEEQEPPD